MTDQVNEAVAWIVPSARVTPDGSWEDGPDSLVLESEATDYIRRIGTPLYAHPSRGVVDELCERLQQKCSDWGTYWRAPDAHGVNLSMDQALELLRDALGVEVEIAQAAALPAVPDDRISVSRAMAGMAATIATEWLDLFAETPGLEKYERYTYGPQVEMLRDDLIAMLAATPAHDQPEGAGND